MKINIYVGFSSCRILSYINECVLAELRAPVCVDGQGVPRGTMMLLWLLLVKTIKLQTLNICSSLYANFTSIKLIKIYLKVDRGGKASHFCWVGGWVGASCNTWCSTLRSRMFPQQLHLQQLWFHFLWKQSLSREIVIKKVKCINLTPWRSNLYYKICPSIVELRTISKLNSLPSLRFLLINLSIK